MMTGRGDDSLTAALLAPTGRDATLAEEFLRKAGMEAVACAEFDELCARVAVGVGAVLVTEEALTPDRVRRLASVVKVQPPWSDLPIIVFSSRPDRLRSRFDLQLEQLGNVSFIDRPVQRRTLVAAVRSALRGRQRQYEARRAIAAREQFLAMLGHELRNPLAAILFSTDLLGRRYSKEAAEPPKQLATIDRQTRHLNRLVDDLLDVGRVTSGKITLKREQVDLAALVARSVEAHQMMAEAHGVSLVFTSGLKPVLVDGDTVRLEQVATNLLTNAIKYTPRGGRVQAWVLAETAHALLRVEDTGVGIPVEYLDSIFELFAQAPTALDRARGGMGLGLTLVRALVELQGGTVRAHSLGSGRGSSFEVRLPRVEASATAAAPEQQSPQKRPSAPAALRIVVVEDNVDVRETLVELLVLQGYAVEEAADGPQGLTRIISTRPGAALVDIGLPGFDGYELARRVRRTLGDSVVLIAMTGYGQADDNRRAHEAGFDGHITKPVSIEDIEAVLTRRHGTALEESSVS